MAIGAFKDCKYADVIKWNAFGIVGILNNLPSVNPQPKTGQWIPVNERLPEEYKEVIVTDIETSDTYLSRYIGNGYWECDNGPFMNRIIAWMPLPPCYVPQKVRNNGY